MKNQTSQVQQTYKELAFYSFFSELAESTQTIVNELFKFGEEKAWKYSRGSLRKTVKDLLSKEKKKFESNPAIKVVDYMRTELGPLLTGIKEVLKVTELFIDKERKVLKDDPSDSDSDSDTSVNADILKEVIEDNTDELKRVWTKLQELSEKRVATLNVSGEENASKERPNSDSNHQKSQILRSQEDFLQSILQKTKNLQRRHREQLASYRSQLNEMKVKVASMEAEVEKKNLRHKKIKAKRSEWKKKYEQLREQNGGDVDLRDRCDRAESRCSELEDELSDVLIKLDRTESALTRKLQLSRELGSENELLRTEIELIRDRILITDFEAEQEKKRLNEDPRMKDKSYRLLIERICKLNALILVYQAENQKLSKQVSEKDETDNLLESEMIPPTRVSIPPSESNNQTYNDTEHLPSVSISGLDLNGFGPSEPFTPANFQPGIHDREEEEEIKGLQELVSQLQTSKFLLESEVRKVQKDKESQSKEIEKLENELERRLKYIKSIEKEISIIEDTYEKNREEYKRLSPEPGCSACLKYAEYVKCLRVNYFKLKQNAEGTFNRGFQKGYKRCAKKNGIKIDHIRFNNI